MATIIRRNMREWRGNCFGKWTISSKLKARYGGNIAFRVACKLQNRRCFGVGTWIPASSEAGRKVATSFARFFPSKEDYTLDTIPKTGCPTGYHPYRKILRITGSSKRDIDFRFQRWPSDRLENPSPVKIVARIEFRTNSRILPSRDGVFPFSNCSQRV